MNHRGGMRVVETPDRTLRYEELRELLDRYARPGAILELGSGPGGLRGRRVTDHVVTVDIRRFAGVAVQADGCRLPFRDGAFSTAVCVDVLEHVPPALRPSLVAELRRVAADLLVVGGPVGAASEDADLDLERWFRRSDRDLPDWLGEHVATGPYPTLRQLDDMVGGEPVACTRGMSVGAHRLTTKALNRRGGTAIGRALAGMPGGLRVLSRLATIGTPYRAVLAYDMRPVTFSVIMATRNRAERLPDAVKSVLDQSRSDLELIIVNDGSDDDTSEVTRRLQQIDDRIRVIDVPSPTGSCGLARNVGLRAARGRLLAFCDDDVRWRAHHLAECGKALEEFDACYTTAARYLPDGRFYDTAGRPWSDSGPQVGDIDANTIAVRRSAMCPFPDGRGRYESEDVLLAIRLFRLGARFRFVPEVTVDYTFNPESHCYDYSFREVAGQMVVESRPVVRDMHAAKNRVTEAAGVRLERLRRSLSARA